MGALKTTTKYFKTGHKETNYYFLYKHEAGSPKRTTGFQLYFSVSNLGLHFYAGWLDLKDCKEYVQ